MPDHTNVYKNQTKLYEQMISKQPSVLKTIEEITPINQLDVIDMGAGSGRLTSVLAPYVKSILALDASAEMLILNEEKLKHNKNLNYQIEVADHRKIPAENESADLVVSGWSIGYLGSSEVENNVHNIEKVMEEIMRVLRAKGMVIIFETMGTGFETPNPPEFLKQYYSLLENKYGFSHKWIRLDYQFDSLKQAEELSRFFFGDELAEKVVRENLITLPECAGIWWLKKER
ncbi:class I SAM-dependent methyltransferase [Jeotgalibacillus marinus]|uniref:Class I SAM-dependent methyltransferase n=1 Tax=Jeotgalibacillus marinus TaxID=86667 RepID=A0ABV3Q5I6_9BACL